MPSMFCLLAGTTLRDAAKLEPAERNAAARQAAVNLYFSAYVLENYGARRFAVLNAPDIGLTPESKLVLNNSASATAATQQYNFALDFMLNYLAFQNQQFSALTRIQLLTASTLTPSIAVRLTRSRMQLHLVLLVLPARQGQIVPHRSLPTTYIHRQSHTTFWHWLQTMKCKP